MFLGTEYSIQNPGSLATGKRANQTRFDHNITEPCGPRRLYLNISSDWRKVLHGAGTRDYLTLEPWMPPLHRSLVGYYLTVSFIAAFLKQRCTWHSVELNIINPSNSPTDFEKSET